jgi:hypothetical protein
MSKICQYTGSLLSKFMHVPERVKGQSGSRIQVRQHDSANQRAVFSVSQSGSGIQVSQRDSTNQRAVSRVSQSVAAAYVSFYLPLQHVVPKRPKSRHCLAALMKCQCAILQRPTYALSCSTQHMH